MTLTSLPMVQKARLADALSEALVAADIGPVLTFRIACNFATTLGLKHGTDDRERFLAHVMGPHKHPRMFWLQDMLDTHGHGGI